MAFTFRIGTKWCHDFPKLAKESGFYFNMHRSSVRVDWNRISNIDIDQIIRERDFHLIDDNINHVIDYCLESEYDVKILDPNFVKLFRLAQLAVEYLLYCKQYLDHSVIILKDELRLKIEENVKLKKEIGTLEEVIVHMKEKAKERSRLIETKIGDCSGEIYKCPHCPKTFISPMFVSAHVIRRHAYAPNLYMPPSPVHDHYRSETEKLHNEIKNLKERLNETERVIRNESERVTEKKVSDYDKQQADNEVEAVKHVNNKSEEQSECKGYQEEIKNLKTMLFDEIHNLRQKEKTMHERTSETSVQTLISQQEKEFQKLKSQLLEKLTPDIEDVQAKLHAQENYWMSKMEQLENQHHKDVERLNAALKLTQNAADDMKAKYEAKINDLERQTANQSNILIEQSKQLHSLSHEMNISQLNEKNRNLENNSSRRSGQFVMPDKSEDIRRKTDERSLKQNDSTNTRVEQIVVASSAINNSTISNLSSRMFPLTENDARLKAMHTSNSKNKFIVREDKTKQQSKQRSLKPGKFDLPKSVEKNVEYCSSSDTFVSEDLIHEEGNNFERPRYNHSAVKADFNGVNKLEDTFNKNKSKEFLSNTRDTKKSALLENNLSSTGDSESSVSDSDTESVTTIDNTSSFREYKTSSPISVKSKKTAQSGSSYKRIQASLMEAFEQKLKDLGIDPEWQGIPKATFKQKMDILKHHHKLAAKKSPRYHQIKLKIIEEVLDKISKKGKAANYSEQLLKKSSPRKIVTNDKLTVKECDDEKDSGNHVSASQVASNKFHSTPEFNRSVKNVIENESTLTKAAKSESYRTMEKLLQVSSSSVKSPDGVQHTINSQEYSTRRDSSNKIRVTPNDRNASNSKYIQDNITNNSNAQQELNSIFVSPKHNKSVLKSASGSASSLTKKKVIFDLTNERDKVSSSDDDTEKEELNESNWNASSISEERKDVSQSEDYRSSTNIVLRTAQSDKIAEISRKLEAQLNMVRQKPVGSVETMFSSKYMQNKENQDKNNEQINSISGTSFLDSTFQASASASKRAIDSLPQPAPRNFRDKVTETLRAESISEISDIDSDIDKILKLE